MTTRKPPIIVLMERLAFEQLNRFINQRRNCNMLIITRRPSETIDGTLTMDLPAGTRFKITLLSINGNQVRVGLEFPRSVTLDREEITRRKLKERLVNGNLAEVAG